MFSSRVPADREPNRLARAVRAAREARRTLIDLTVTNPTAAGIEYPPAILDALADPAGLRYEPHPLGANGAREAIAQDYARRGIAADPSRIVLTASTSEAYSVLFKVLCESAGDAVLVPVPSYPLFDHLTRLDGVVAMPYRLDYHGRWCVDVGALDAAWIDSVRAVLAVSPNNPTGSMLTPAEMDTIGRLCAERGAALILDEVFADYAFERSRRSEGAAATCLTFSLGGLSKSAGLPQVKLGWFLVEGPDVQVREALDRLELVCDTYLSVSTPVQIAAPSLLRDGAAVREQIRDRVRGNHERLRRLAASHPSVEVLPCDGGWSAVLRIAATRSEEDVVLELLDRDEVLVHPGFFFDFPHESFLIVSLLTEPSPFAEGARRLMERVDV